VKFGQGTIRFDEDDLRTFIAESRRKGDSAVEE
jgi:hypothetical protein